MSKAHARFSPSRLEKLSVCPCFQYREAIGGGDSPDANEGRLLHSAAENENTKGLTEEQANAVNFVLGVISSIKAGLSPDVLDFKETRIEIPDLTFGFADRVMLDLKTRRGLVADYKFGRKVVTEARDNFQVQAYVTGVFLSNPEIDKITGYILAPRCPGDEVSSHEFDRSIVQATCDRIDKLYDGLDDPFKKPRAEDSELCALCRNNSRCPEVGATAVLVARSMGLPMPENFRPDAIVSARDRLTGQLIAGALETWSEQVKKNNLEFVNSGGDIPGLNKRTRSLGVRLPKENTVVGLKALVDAGYATMEQALGAASLTLGELARIGTELHGSKEVEEKELIKEILDGLTTEGTTCYLQKAKSSDIKALLG